MLGEESRTITIDARAERDFEPDTFHVEVNFMGERAEKAECAEAYNADRGRVLAALEAAGIAVDEVRSGAFRVYVNYEWYYERAEGASYDRYRRTERYVDGCEYSGSCFFDRKMDLALLAGVWDALQGTEGDFTFEITYDLERPDECERELLRSAVAEARSRAEVLANAAGAQLGPVASMRHGFRHAAATYANQPMAYGAADCSYDGADPLAPALNPEAVPVTCEVSVSWLIA